MPDGPVPGLYLGVGLSSAAVTDEVADLVAAVLAVAGVDLTCVASVGTIERLATDPRLGALGRPVVGWPAGRLAAVGATAPGAVAAVLAGAPSVAEAAALLGAGEGATLLVAKRASAHATAALAGRPRPGVTPPASRPA